MGQARALIGRLAPSPTGVLHLGNARSFLLAWLSIRSRGGRLLLRIEDIDGPRVRSGAIESSIEDLQWLGLDWDGEIQLQSSQRARHDQVLADLIGAGFAYPCVCTRKEVEEAASAPHENSVETSRSIPVPAEVVGAASSRRGRRRAETAPSASP